MGWQENERLRKLYLDIEEVNKTRKDDQITLSKALELNSVHNEMIRKMTSDLQDYQKELEKFKEKLAKTAAESLEKDMKNYAEILAVDKVQILIHNYLDSNLENMLTKVLERMNKRHSNKEEE